MTSGSPEPSSSSSQSSRTPPPQVLGGKTSKSSKEKAKSKSKAESLQGRSGRNEGTDPTWNYAPPPGAVLINDDVDAGEFDWDMINDNDDLELWLIRVPNNVRLIKVFSKVFLISTNLGESKAPGGYKNWYPILLENRLYWDDTA